MKFTEITKLCNKLNRTISKDSIDKYEYAVTLADPGLILLCKEDRYNTLIMKGKYLGAKDIEIITDKLGKFFLNDPNRYVHSNYQLLRMMLCIHKKCSIENLRTLILDKDESIRQHAYNRLKFLRKRGKNAKR